MEYSFCNECGQPYIGVVCPQCSKYESDLEEKLKERNEYISQWADDGYSVFQDLDKEDN
jgi:uncharacterized Zn finger protein (UPF0148 family)